MSIPYLTVVSKVKWRGGLDVVAEWKKGRALTPEGADMKYTLPGPLTIIGTTANRFYATEAELAADLAEILNEFVVRPLAAAGCRYVQVDEPVFARKPEAALEYGVKLLDKCFRGTGGGDCQRLVHICCGYPERLDQKGYLKVVYFRPH